MKDQVALDEIPLEGFNLGKMLKELREQGAIPQRSIYESGRFKQSHVSNVENGKAEPDIKMIEEYTSALGLDFYDVILKIIDSYENHLKEKINHMKAIKALIAN